MSNLRSVLKNLESDKIKERSEALASIRELFTDRLISRFHITRDGESEPRLWLPVFQALFSTVTIETKLATKKSTAKSGTSAQAAERRALETARMVRHLVERNFQFLDAKVTKPLFRHLVQMLPADRSPDGRLSTLVGLDYAKALKCLVGFTPHLEHLDDGKWVEIVEKSFNVILDDPILSSFAADEEQSMMEDPDSDIQMEDEEASEVPESEDHPTATRKRSRTEQSYKLRGSPTKSQARQRQTNILSVSLEQVEFASILSIMISSPVAPILSKQYPGLASGILVRLERFLDRYPTDSSLLHDFLSILSSTLQHIALNKKYEVVRFARSTWSNLVGLWGTKDKRMKEGLIIVLRNLFPYTNCPVYMEGINLPPFNCGKEIGRLRDLLDSEAESRWGVDGLSLDALRLQIIDTKEESHIPALGGVFIAKTFRAGWNFDAEQALSWAILELHADCLSTLFQLSEAMDSTAIATPSRRNAKRTKILDPLSSLLESLHSTSKTFVRSYRLQTLLFFVDRHWHTLHQELKEQIIQTLLQYVGVDDATVQSWVFLNFASIAYAEGVKVSDSKGATLNPAIWDSIWTHATRRANVPTICRAACHTGQAILVTNSCASGVLITSHRILLEIETLAKDMDLQGPAYPYDSVCMFLARCLTIASQDARLYRMQLEDKVLSWLVDTWKINVSKTKMVTTTVQDILVLLEAICALSKKAEIIALPILPHSQIVESMIEEGKTKIIEDYLLYARLPHFATPPSTKFQTDVSGEDVKPKRAQLVAPRGRERKVSSFLLKTLEALLLEWEGINDNNSHPTAETVRQALDLAICALFFESLLSLNGTAPNRQIFQSAAKLILTLVTLLTSLRWTTSEKLLIAHGFEVLVTNEQPEEEDSFHTALSPPCPTSGIKAQTLENLLRGNNKINRSSQGLQLELLRLIWQNADVRDALDLSMKTLRSVLSQFLKWLSSDPQGSTIDVDDKDGFGPIRTAAFQNTATNTGSDDGRSVAHMFNICLNFISYGSFLQSHSSEPTRDRDLTQLIVESAGSYPERFSVLCPFFFSLARKGILYLPAKHLTAFFEEFASLLGQYSFSRNERFHRVVLDLLTSSLGIWKTQDAKADDVEEQFRQLCCWLSNTFVKENIRSWSLRDAFSRFLDRYLMEDPTQKTWLYLDDRITEENCEDFLPTSLLPKLNGDPDIRVRFRAAVSNTRLFYQAQPGDTTPYNRITDSLTKDVDMFEYMLTRMLALGNVMVVSDSVRRGAYWHLLEACIHSNVYTKHIEAILIGTSERLGIFPLSSLFELYAAQLAFAVNKANADFMSFPSHLLGYRDKRHCAEATFRALTPTNVIINDMKTFTTHCKILQKSVLDGLEECFGDILGFLIVYILDNFGDAPYSNEDVNQQIMERMTLIPDFNVSCQENLDGVIIQIFRTLGDQDCSDNGAIVSALKKFDSQAIPTFRTLNKFRSVDNPKTYPPNVPAFSTSVILQSLAWLSSKFPDSFNQTTTYHVIQGLLNEIHQTPLVNEQIRLVNALTLWLACRREDIKDGIILHALVQGATLLLSQWDLARSAQSILDATFRTYRKSNYTDPQLPNLLIRVCSIAHDYVSNAPNQAISELGTILGNWIDEHAFEMTNSGLQSLVLQALPAWPREPSSRLLPLYHQTTLASLGSVLETHQITSNKFRIVRRFRDQALEYGHDCDDDKFSKTYFWRLKDCMPTPELLHAEDVGAFADLLALHHGQISSFDVEKPDNKAARNRHIDSYSKQKSGGKTHPAREAIKLALLMMLEDDNPLRVLTAYNTLRLVTAVAFQQNVQWQVSAEYRQRLEFFRACRRSPKTRPRVDILNLLTTEAYLEAASNFRCWVSLFSTLIGDTLAAIDPFFGQLSTIFSTDIDFSEEILPILIVTLLICHKQTNSGTPFKKVLSEYFTAVLSSGSTDIRCIRSVVDVVLHSRCFLFPNPKEDSLAYNEWFAIDFTLLARSAILCGAYTTALLFVELAAEPDPDKSQDSAVVEQVLYDIYAHIDEPDGFYGIKTDDLHQFLVKRFHHEQQWDKAFRFHGAALEAGITGRGDQEGLIDSFHSFGLDQLAVDTLRNMSAESFASKSSSVLSYKLGWRTETWDLPDRVRDAPNAPLYRSLRAMHRERDSRTLEDTIRGSLVQEMSNLRALGSENLTGIRAVSRDLMCLSQIQEWRQLDYQETKQEHIADKWINLDHRFEFSDFEAIMATRISLIRSVRQREERLQIGTLVTPIVQRLRDMEKRCLVCLSQAARATGQIQVALNSVVRAKQLDSVISSEVSEEFANVLWLQKEERSAVQFLQGLVGNDEMGPNSTDPLQKALRLSRLGTWTSDACLEKPSMIWQRYFSPAIELLDSLQHETTASEKSRSIVLRECAIFAERQFHAASKSSDAIRWKVYVERKKQEIEQRGAELAKFPKSQAPNHARDRLQFHQKQAVKLLHEDSALFSQHNVLRESFLKQAIDMHSRCLESSSDFDNDSAIRFCSLWFANFDDPSVLETVINALERIPSHKLVFLAHQITARVSSISHSPQQENLQKLVLRMCQEHPFHTLYQVYCISDRPDFTSDPSRRQSGRLSSQPTQNTQTERGAAASSILDRLREDPHRGKTVKDVERLCDAYLQWAQYPISSNVYKTKIPYAVPTSMKILGIQNLKVPVSTARTPVDPRLLYDNCEWIQSYDREFSTAGGVNLPKISKCQGSNGNTYKQLFKGQGKDDLRQDAVMEQVFDLVNSILRHDRETRRRQLRVRDYKVIPLAAQAGLLEFVANTTPLRDWLIKAHKTYRPQDDLYSELSNRMKKAQDGGCRPEMLLELFLDSKKRFKPVMRHYFTKNHKNPISWFQMRLNYSRSVATTSVVGHVLGLGDRHTSNILLDNVTGDVVHIDLGIAFDQGKLLGVPETVPFRMTADMVDGMGISGTSGVFQRCAEETLRVLRDESDVIMTVLEVFKHDPLHSWTASEYKVRQAQCDAPVATTVATNDTARYNLGLGIGIDMTSGTAEEAADRALSSVARKLDKSLSVESTVNELIAEATDPMNLATLYTGWGALL